MKSLHKLILGAFLGPFLITFSVLVFIFVSHHVLKYSDEFVGKGLEAKHFIQLMFYFSFNMVPRAMPLAVMLSALMTYGNLGQHNELAAIKSAGISMVKILMPVLIFVAAMSVGLFYFSDRVIPKTNLEAWSLLYDMRQKKPALEFKEGMFFNGLPNYSIRIGKKYRDGQSMKDVVVYDHSEGKGNVSQVMADSGRMYMINEDTYLVFELFNGSRNGNTLDEYGNITTGFTRSTFDHSKMIFDLSSFKLNRSDKSLFTTNRFMLSTKAAQEVMDSMALDAQRQAASLKERIVIYYKFGLYDSTQKYTKPNYKLKTEVKFDSTQIKEASKLAYSQVKSIHYLIQNKKDVVEGTNREIANIGIEKLHKYTDSASVLAMFLIGAAMGAILKKGGLGVPTLLTIVFFILYYVVSLNGEKSVKHFQIDMYWGTWLPVILLIPIGLFFTFQAHRDARMFEFEDVWQRMKKMWKN